MTRTSALVALLCAYLDFHPWPETWTGKMNRRATKSGPAPSHRVPCEACEQTGKVRGLTCQRCGGKGRYYIDEYTLAQVSTADSQAHDLDRRLRCDRCGGDGEHGNGYKCSRCLGTGRVPDTKFRLRLDETGDGDGSHLLDAIEREDIARNHPTWRALEDAMRRLRRLDPHGHTLISLTYVLAIWPPETLPEESQEWLRLALLALDRAMPAGFELDLPREIVDAERHRQAAHAAAKGKQAARPAQAARDHEMRRLYGTGGWTHEQLAEKYAVTRARVTQILGLKVRPGTFSSRSWG